MNNKKLLAVLLTLAMLFSAGTFAVLASTSDGSIEFDVPEQDPPGIKEPPDDPPPDDPNPDRWKAVMENGLDFGVVEASSVDKYYKSIEAVDALDDGELLPIASRVAGLRVVSNESWKVTVTIGEFKFDGKEYLGGFQFALQSYAGTTENVSGTDYSAPVDFGIPAGGSWNRDGATEANKIYANGGGIIVAEGSNPAGLLLNAHYGANYEGFLSVPGASLKPDGVAQADIFWNYEATP